MADVVMVNVDKTRATAQKDASVKGQQALRHLVPLSEVELSCVVGGFITVPRLP
jgi:hypothetical protein